MSRDIFLIREDYIRRIPQEVYRLVVEDEVEMRIEAEGVAEAFARHHLCKAYDVAALFPTIQVFDEAASYIEGDLVAFSAVYAERYGVIGWSDQTIYDTGDLVTWRERIYRSRKPGNQNVTPHNSVVYWEEVGGIYRAVADGTGNLPTDTAFWAADDPRDPMIVKHMCSMVIAELVGRHATRAMPQHIQDDVDDAMLWFADARAGKFALSCGNEDIVTGSSIILGSTAEFKDPYY